MIPQVTVDPESGAVYLMVRADKVLKTIEVHNEATADCIINLDVGVDGRLIGVEIIDGE